MTWETINPKTAKIHLHECNDMEEIMGCIWMGNIRLALERMKEIGQKEGRLIGATKMKDHCVTLCATIDGLPVSKELKACGTEIAEIIAEVDAVAVIYDTRPIRLPTAADAINDIRGDLAALAQQKQEGEE